MNALAPLLPHAYAPVPGPSRPQPRSPPPLEPQAQPSGTAKDSEDTLQFAPRPASAP